jgi:hypothetical protein
VKRAAEIFGTGLNPPFTDLNVWRGELRLATPYRREGGRTRRRRSSALRLRFNVDNEMIGSDVIANETALIGRWLIEKNID